MTEMVLVIDESGAKGHAKTREKNPGEIGVMAALFYLKEEIDQIKIHLDRIVKPYLEHAGKKTHITELPGASQAQLREELFSFMKKINLRWFYSAIYAEGFHQSELAESRGGAKNDKESLHATLFQNIFCHSVIIAHHNKIQNLDILVRTDNIDSGVIKNFKNYAKTVSDLFLRKERTITRTVRSEDPKRRSTETIKISTKTDDIPVFSRINTEFVCENSSLTILVDTLANSVLYYLNEAKANNIGVPLNNKETLKKHPLVELAHIPENDKEVVNIVDILYRRESPFNT